MQTRRGDARAGSQGSCRDTAWLLVQVLRHLGLAARFVSGYLIQLKPDVKPLDGPGRRRAETSPTCMPGPRSICRAPAGSGSTRPPGLLCGEGHLPLAATPHYRVGRADQRRGRAGRGHVLVRHEHYADRREAARHLAVLRRSLGRARCARRARSMPISRPATCASPWAASRPSSRSTTISRPNGTPRALGPTKRMRADELIRRLRDRFAPGGLLHYGQGKWYPGEPLPRWAFSLYWRRDGKPIWRDPALIATEASTRTRLADDAQRFAESVAARLGITAGFVQPAFEDPADRMLKEGELPANIDPSNPKIDDPQRARPHHARVRAPLSASPPATCCRCSAGPRRPRPGWISEVWQTAPRPAVPGAGRFSHRLAPAAQLAAPISRRPTTRIWCRPIRSRAREPLPDPAAPAPPSRPRARSAPRGERAGVLARPRCRHPLAEAPRPPAAIPVRTALAVEPRDGTALRVHAAGRAARGLSRAARRRRGDRRRARPADPHRGLSAAARPAPQRHQGDARSRRHRGQHPSGGDLARGGRDHHRGSTRRRGSPGSAPTSS